MLPEAEAAVFIVAALQSSLIHRPEVAEVLSELVRRRQMLMDVQLVARLLCGDRRTFDRICAPLPLLLAAKEPGSKRKVSRYNWWLAQFLWAICGCATKRRREQEATDSFSVALSKRALVRIMEIADTCRVQTGFVVSVALCYGVNEATLMVETDSTSLDAVITTELQERIAFFGDMGADLLGRICVSGLQKADQYFLRLNVQDGMATVVA